MTGNEDRRFSLNGVCCHVCWSGSSTAKCSEFYEELVGLLPEGTRLFGGKRRGGQDGVGYDVVLKLPKKVHWTDVRNNLGIPVDGLMVGAMEVPKARQGWKEFVANCQDDIRRRCDETELFGVDILEGDRVVGREGSDTVVELGSLAGGLEGMSLDGKRHTTRKGSSGLSIMRKEIEVSRLRVELAEKELRLQIMMDEMESDVD